MVVVVEAVVGYVVGSSVRDVRLVLCVPIAWEQGHRSVPVGEVDASCVPEVQTLLQRGTCHPLAVRSGCLWAGCHRLYELCWTKASLLLLMK